MATTTRRPFAVHTNQANTAAQRKRELGHIHKGSDFLKWSKDDYHFHLRNVTGAASAADLDAEGRRKMLDFLAKNGYTPYKFVPFDQTRKIKWLWNKIGKAGGLRDDSEAALLIFIGRTTGNGVSQVEFLPTHDASNVIEALKAMLARAEKAQRAGVAAR